MLAAHRAARHALGAHGWPATLETSGTLVGLGTHGTFQRWRDGALRRDDETLGMLRQRTLRLADREEVQGPNDDVRTIPLAGGPYARTVRFIGSGAFARHPEDARLIGAGRTPDGRAVWLLKVTPPGGVPVTLGLDRGNGLIDEIVARGASYREYRDYRVVDGELIPFEEVTVGSNRALDVTARVTRVRVGAPIPAGTFAPFVPATIAVASPVTRPLLEWHGHIFVRARVDGQPMLFMLDSGSQGVFIDPAAAQRIGLAPQGRVEVEGAATTRGGVVRLGAIAFGAAQLTIRAASVIDLSGVTYEGKSIDGILGYPLFAAAEVRFDPVAHTVTFARPGTLPVQGHIIAVDARRRLPEIAGQIDRLPARLLIDTGNTDELLVFHSFIAAHPGLIDYAGAGRFARNRGIGGSSAAVPVMVDQIALGPYPMYNRYATVILSGRAAFDDSADDGNVGWATLKNFVATFDLGKGFIQLQPTRWFDDGRFRSGSP